MPLIPHSWSIIVAGSWNTAILTPDGIRSRLFELPVSTPIVLEVEIGSPNVFRAKLERISVCPTNQNILFLLDAPTIEDMEEAAKMAKRALTSLPDTPVVAAGFNFKYRLEGVSIARLDSFSLPFDNELADEDSTLVMVGKNFKRTIKHEDGVLNLEIDTSQENAVEVGYNFHKDSTNPKVLEAWMNGCRNAMIKVEIFNKLLTN